MNSSTFKRVNKIILQRHFYLSVRGTISLSASELNHVWCSHCPSKMKIDAGTVDRPHTTWIRKFNNNAVYCIVPTTETDYSAYQILLMNTNSYSTHSIIIHLYIDKI